MPRQQTRLILLFLIATAIARNGGEAADCSATSPCADKSCCSEFGFCGFSRDHCGKGCRSNCDATGNVAVGGGCSAAKKCANDNECCSRHGYCGTTAEHCGEGCLSNCRMQPQLTTPSSTPKGECDARRLCPNNMCCSKYGYCGDTADHCGEGCLSNCRMQPQQTTPSSTPKGECDNRRVCPNNKCCSKYGYCGDTADHCGNGCLSNCDADGSTGRRTTTTTTTTTTPHEPVCSATKPCRDGTACCSRYGYCGTTSEHCGSGCVSNCPKRNKTDNGVASASLGRPFQAITSCKELDTERILTLPGENKAWLCEGCPYLTWNKAPNISISGDWIKPVAKMTTNKTGECFRACLLRDCVAFTMDLQLGECLVYDHYGSWSLTSDLIYVVSYFRKIESTVVMDEWIYSRPAAIEGTPFHTEILSDGRRNFGACLSLCAFRFHRPPQLQDQQQCRGVEFSHETGSCLLFNETEGTVTKLASKRVAIQHISILRDDNRWRFDAVEGKTFAAAFYLTLSSIPIDDCLAECLEDPNCNGVTIAGRGTNRDCSLVGDTSGDWREPSAGNVVVSYLLRMPKNKNSQRPVAAEYSPMVFWNTDTSYILARHDKVESAADCVQKVQSSFNPNGIGSSKVTYVSATKECLLFQDWAQIVEPREVPQAGSAPVQSYLVQATSQWQYYAYERLPGLYAPPVRTPQVFKKEGSTAACLDTCLTGHTCAAVMAVYNGTEHQLYCYYYTDIDLKNVTLAVHASSEVFVKLDLARVFATATANSSNPVDMCAFGGDVDVVPSTLETLRQINQSIFEIESSSNESLTLRPHGDHFGGFLENGAPPPASASGRTSSKRSENEPHNHRRRRGFFDNLWSGIKKIGGAIVKGVKAIGGAIKKGVETVLKPIDNLIRPVTTWINKNIISPVMEHVVNPVLKPVLNLIEPIAGPVMDLVDSILPDSPTFDILTGGVLRKNIFKGRNKVKRDTKTPDRDVKKKTNEEKKRKEDSDNNRCERAVIRPGKNNCKKKQQCAAPVVAYMDDKVKTQCSAKGDNQMCTLKCRDGYEPSNNKLTCVAPAKGTSYWRPRGAKCETEGCKDVPYVQVRSNPRSKFPLYLVKFQKSKKLPLWSMYYHPGSIGTTPNVGKSFRQYPCKELKVFQLGGLDYLNGGYDRGHLTPQNAMRLDPQSNKATNFYINVAPQDPWTNQNPWKSLEGKVETHTGLIVTGVCKKTTTVGKLPVPGCYWKMVCTKNKGKHTAAAFYHDNTKLTSEAAKKKRKEQIAKAMNQADVAMWIGPTELADVWKAATKYLGINLRGKRDLSDGLINPVECALQQTLSEEDRQFWASLINVNSWNMNWNDPKNEDIGDDEDGDGAGRDGSDLDDGDIENCGESCNNAPTCGRKVIGYYTSWGSNLLRAKQASYLTHVIYAFMEMKADGSIQVGSADPVNTKDYDKDSKLALARLQHLVRLKEVMGGRLKVLFAVGGWENSQYYSSVAASEALTTNFVRSAMDILVKYNLDGIDIDWEYPVTGGAHDGTTGDKQNYVKFLKALRSNLDYLQAKTGRSDRYLITIASAAGSWVLEVGYDLEEIIKVVDWINVMTYDYYGAWTSKWGAYTGPVAPLFFGAPDRYSGKMNVDFTMKFYVCRTNHPEKIVMGLGFYGRYWNNVGQQQVKSGDDLWRMAEPISGGFASYRDIKKDWFGKPGYERKFHEDTKTPFLWSAADRVLMAYEDEKSLAEKVKYAASRNLGGVMIWAVDLDDDQLSLLKTVSSDAICSGGGAPAYKCNPLTEKRWWTPEDDEKDNAGMCGRMAPLYKGYYPVCDPDDPGYSCCGKFGFCGKGPKFCDCPECANYGEEPKKVLDEPVKPTGKVQWHLLNTAIPTGQPRCGYNAPKLNGKYAICNPDAYDFCCSAAGYCGNTDEFCKCKGCVNFKANPNYEYPEK